MRIAILGASGFVGASLFERWRERDDLEVVPFIRGSGSAWRLARHGAELSTVDVMSAPELRSALDGFTHVVNCTRGARPVMVDGMRNLVAACKAARVQRLIHLSSVSVYGDPPVPESEREDAVAELEYGSYGWTKLQQDRIVERAHRSGLDSVVLCPPNIGGAYSSFVCSVLEDFRAGTLALIDGGSAPINVVDVQNLCRAIELALTCERTDGKRIFVTDGDGITWRQYGDALLPLLERDELPSVGREVFATGGGGGGAGRKASVVGALKQFVSSDVRAALRKDPILDRIDRALRKRVRHLPFGLEDRLRLGIEGTLKVGKVGPATQYSSLYNQLQLRTVVHRIDRAEKVLGYRPELTFEESMRRFRRWYEVTHGFGDDAWGLVRELEAALADLA